MIAPAVARMVLTPITSPQPGRGYVNEMPQGSNGFADPGPIMGGPVEPPAQLHGAPRSYGAPDASNPAAVAFATQRLQQLVRAHLLGAMPQNMADPTQVWRGLSATLQQNPQALQAFLAASGLHRAVSYNGRH